MAGFSSEEARTFYAETYDTVMSDWPGELRFYSRLAEEQVPPEEKILEIASGTGRVSLHLAREGFWVHGLDSSPPMIAIAKEKSAGMKNVEWTEADMRSFDLGETFPLVIIPAHSFQNLTTIDDHLAALESIRGHLSPNGILVIHIDHLSLEWLSDLVEKEGGAFSLSGSFIHPITNQRIEIKHAWSYDPYAQTATLDTIWEAVDDNGEALESWKNGPLQFHCFFRFEMEHLLHRAGFELIGIFGDFEKGELRETSSEMIWVVRKSDINPTN